MELSNLYDLIRKEPVCLFVGSGFSLYAGMPSARSLIDILLDNLTSIQRKKIDQHVDLRKFTDDYEILFGRAKLIEILQNHIDITPADKHLHDLLAKIPYFKSVITTNYDRLIEDSMGKNACVLVKNTDIFNPIQAKCRIFKIHGDIRDEESIIISNSDYIKQHNRIFKDPFWASVIAEISSKHVIFLGYGYEDDNILADFDYIEEKLKSKNKKRILISPVVNSLKQKKLKQMNIDYIQADGETFVNGLIANLKLNIIEDHRLGLVNTQIAQDFITAFDMKVASIATKVSADFTEISRVDGPTLQTIKFTSSDQELFRSLKEFMNDYQLRDLKITSGQLESFAFLIEDFNFLGKDTLAHLSVSHIPKFHGLCKIRFPDQDFEIKRVFVRLFNSIPGKLLIEVEISGFKAEFSIKILDGKAKFNFMLTEPEQPATVKRTYEVMRAFYLFFLGKKVEIVAKGYKPVIYQLAEQIHAREFKQEMEIFNALRKIEKSFKIKFPPVAIRNITEENKRKIQKLMDLITQGYYAVKDKDGIIIEQMPNSREVFEALSSPVKPESYMSMITKSGQELELFGQRLQLGAEQISMKQPTPIVLDFERLLAQFIPVDKILIYHYEKFGLWERPQSKTLWGEDGKEQ